MPIIYLDYAATTPVDPQVANIMMQYLSSTENFGNPHSTHSYGKSSKQAVEFARSQVASLINAHSNEIIWTSGATESNNLALKGGCNMYRSRGNHIITVNTEHKSVLDSCQYLVKQGVNVSFLQPQRNGLVNLNDFTASLRNDTILVSIMLVNNELGSIQNIHEIANITQSKGILLHVDAAQAAGKVTIDVHKTPIDMLSLCAHKLYGPKGIGALYLRNKPRVKVSPQMHGGNQEQGLRAGTLATHQIVGMGAACHLAQQAMTEETHKIKKMRDYFLAQLQELNYTIHGDQNHTVPHILNIRFQEIPATLILNNLPQLALSTGSACQNQQSSHVLRALGLNTKQAQAAIRISFGRFTTWEEIYCATNNIKETISALNN